VAVRRGACDLLPYDEQIRGLFAQLLRASAVAAPASHGALAPQGPRISTNASAFISQPSAPSAGADSQPAHHGLRPLPPPQGPGQGRGSSSQGSYPQSAEQQGYSQVPDPQAQLGSTSNSQYNVESQAGNAQAADTQDGYSQTGYPRSAEQQGSPQAPDSLAQPGSTNNGQYNIEVLQQYGYRAAADNTFPGNAQQFDNSQSALPQPPDYPSQSPNYPLQPPTYSPQPPSYPQQQPAYPGQAPQPAYVPQPPVAAPPQESSFQRVFGAIAKIAEAVKTIPGEDRPHPIVRGIVRNAAGVPVSGASVAAVEWNQSTRTGSDGTFSLEGGPAGRVTVRITATGYQDTEQLAQAATGSGERQEFNIRNQ